ncbi:hypothetical protein F7725_021452 [Dissostichus mawsoni]|uniref:Uncharacterized protein n=1 Tax=Dissostichus mawsoni TaxID=36200 RepID=A0A7J5ZBU6_DISMA|nr:hypothetical protein F7725_021452 [Dissostichus mawsoni]
MASLSFVNKYVNCLFLLQGQSVNALMTSQLLLGSIFLWSPSTYCTAEFYHFVQRKDFYHLVIFRQHPNAMSNS